MAVGHGGAAFTEAPPAPAPCLHLPRFTGGETEPRRGSQPLPVTRFGFPKSGADSPGRPQVGVGGSWTRPSPARPVCLPDREGVGWGSARSRSCEESREVGVCAFPGACVFRVTYPREVNLVVIVTIKQLLLHKCNHFKGKKNFK